MNNLLKQLNHLDLDGILLISDESRKYFADFVSSFGYLIFLKDKIYYITDSRYFEEAKKSVFKGIEVINTESANLYPLLKELLNGVKYLGAELEILSHNFCLNLINQLNVNLIDISSEILKITSVKNKTEIDCIIKGCEICDGAFESILAKVIEGVTERELAYELEYILRRSGADDRAFETIVAFSENAAVPHHKPCERKLRTGDIILFDFGAKVSGYHSDISRTVAFGSVSGKFKETYKILAGAQNLAIGGVKPGMKCFELDKIVKDYLNKFSLDNYFTHGLGHGVGLKIHEHPSIKKENEGVFENNMVFTIEPGIYLVDNFGIRIEDTVWLKDDKAVCLTKAEKKLIIIN